MPKPMYDRNGIALYHGDSAGVLPALSVKADLIVTSPPFEQMREYGGHGYCFESVAPAIADALADGGVMCWHTNDMVEDGGYSGASFDAALWFMREGGLRLYDRIIAVKSAMPIRGGKRWFQNWDFIFVFTRGAPRTFNQIKDRRNAHSGNIIKVGSHSGMRYENGDVRRRAWDYTIPEYSKRTAIWQVLTGSELVVNHPAPMSIRLAEDLIRAYSNEGDLVLDPFSGSGTTAYAAQILGRRATGIEIHKPYIEDAIATRFAHQPLCAVSGN